MNWHAKNTNSGQIVASQTTHGDYKDLHIVTAIGGAKEGAWALVSLQDGYCNSFAEKDELIEWLNKHRHAPIAKVIGSGPMPEDRAGLPAVQIIGLRHSQ